MCQYYSYSPDLKVAIVGRCKDTINYEKALQAMDVGYIVTMDLGKLPDYDALLLPGGGDITPAFFGQKNHGSKNIDIELDITQLQALDVFVKQERPVLGICKGMQIINVFSAAPLYSILKNPQGTHGITATKDMLPLLPPILFWKHCMESI